MFRRPSLLRTLQRARRHARLRKRVRGTSARPRLSVFHSKKHLLLQLIDDDAGATLLSVSDRELSSGSARTKAKTSAGVARAHELGARLAEKAQALGVTQAVFDRGGRAYRGRVKAVAEGARAGGLHF